MSSTALDALRARTRAAHEALDGALTGSHDGTGGTGGTGVTDLDGYARLLTTLSALHTATDAPLRAWAARTAWHGEHLRPEQLPDRAHLYAADLRRLGRRVAPVPLRQAACGEAEGLGTLYVVAGSSAGARIVLRGLPDDLAPDARRGLTDAAGPGSAVLWRDTRRVLGRPLPADLVEEAAHHAEALFARLLDTTTRAAA